MNCRSNTLPIAVAIVGIFLSPSACSLRQERVSFLTSFYQLEEPEFRLHRAILAGDHRAAIRLIDAGSDLNLKEPSGETPLIMAVIDGNVRIVAKLLSADADPNVQDNDGWTPLMFAAVGHPFESIRANPEINERPDTSPRTQRRWDQILALLLASGANASLTNRTGETALSIASRRERTTAEKIISSHRGQPIIGVNP